MTDALRDAELLAHAAGAFLGGELPETDALAAYARARDAAIPEIFAATRALGAFPPAEEFERRLRHLSAALDAEAQHLAARPLPAGVVAPAA